MTLKASFLPYRIPLKLIPTLVGVLAPLDLVLSIPPLTITWEHINADSKIGKAIPSALIGLASSAAGCQALASVFLMGRYLEYHTVMSTWLAIFFNFLSGFFMIYPIYVSIYHDEQGLVHTFNTDILAGTISSILSIFITVLLLIDRKNSYKKGRGSSLVSPSQRILMYMLISTIAWASLGAIVFSVIEKWDFMNSFYFSIVTMATIGFGDLFPTQLATRIFLFPFASIGILLLGLLINAIRIVILERVKRIYENRVYKRQFTRASIKLSDISPVVAAEVEPGQATEIRQEHREFLDKQRRYHLIHELQFAALILILFWSLGAALFMAVEKWSYFDGLYFCFVSFTTIGYGDTHVKTLLGTVAFITFSLFGLVAMAYLISVGSEIFSTTLGQRIIYINTEIHNHPYQESFEAKQLNLILTKVQSFSELDRTSTLALTHLIEASHQYHVQVAKLLVDVEGKLGHELLCDHTFQHLEADHRAYAALLGHLRGQPNSS